MSYSSKSQIKFYNASISLLVVPDLPLALGVPITWILPPHYTTTSLLPSSSESYGQADGQSHKGTIIYSLLRNFHEMNEVVQKDVISIDKDRIKTTDSNNIVCIQAKDRTTGRTEIAACIKVVEVLTYSLLFSVLLMKLDRRSIMTKVLKYMYFLMSMLHGKPIMVLSRGSVEISN